MSSAADLPEQEAMASTGGGQAAWERGSEPDLDSGWVSSGDYPTELQEIRTRVHRRLLERLNLANLSERDQEEAADEVRKIVRDLLASEETPLNLEEREMLVEQVINEVFGLGPHTTRCSSRSTVGCTRPTCGSGTTVTSFRSSTGSYRRWGGG
jgi:hypothetical protein